MGCCTVCTVCNIIINQTTEGLVPCFTQTVVAINPAEDNNKQRKSGWIIW